ncbi:hypothetical protein CDD80_6897 [Ophiocordyceps camponoti-rufipedis]|uniref:Uncharacterized protein n=1 Tax=Ophiocordyceps camponoti-rufipedis TaxID=2004952 RepID=A0A2C5ZIG2_9HYPO|nr:hypothetical protein CDD80_6897 [Ophiocordyceps camponoti-rufipedis]
MSLFTVRWLRYSLSKVSMSRLALPLSRLLLLLACISGAGMVLLLMTGRHDQVWRTRPWTRLEADGPDSGVDWSRFAYTQYVTNSEYLCNSVMLFEILHRLSSKPHRVIMYPSDMMADPLALEADTDDGRLLIKARDRYRVRLVPISVQHKDTDEGTWADSFTKLLAFNQTQYQRVLSLDSDAVILQAMDELFLLPRCPVAMPRAYWLYPEKKMLGSQLMLIQPSREEFQRVMEKINSANRSEYDMEIVNDLYQDSAMILPHRPYTLLTAEFRNDNHSRYLGSDREPWDPAAVFNETKYIHFSDWPVPKPWIAMTRRIRSDNQPKCRVIDGVKQCVERDIWNGCWAYRELIGVFYRSTWFLPPDFTFLPDGQMALGSVIPDPRRPTVTLASLSDHPAIKLPEVRTIIEKNHVLASAKSRTLGLGLMARFLAVADANAKTDLSWHKNKSFSAVDHEVRSYNGAFSSAAVKAIVALDEVKRHIDGGHFGKRYVYIITGLRVAQQTMTVTDEKGRKTLVSLGGSASVPAGTVPVGTGGGVSGGVEDSKTDGYETAAGVVLAYRLHVVRPKGANVEVELFSCRTALCSDQSRIGGVEVDLGNEDVLRDEELSESNEVEVEVEEVRIDEGDEMEAIEVDEAVLRQDVGLDPSVYSEVEMDEEEKETFILFDSGRQQEMKSS